jgi:hypothetical protein
MIAVRLNDIDMVVLLLSCRGLRTTRSVPANWRRGSHDPASLWRTYAATWTLVLRIDNLS